MSHPQGLKEFIYYPGTSDQNKNKKTICPQLLCVVYKNFVFINRGSALSFIFQLKNLL